LWADLNGTITYAGYAPKRHTRTTIAGLMSRTTYAEASDCPIRASSSLDFPFRSERQFG
jgi:hypothetical protein